MHRRTVLYSAALAATGALGPRSSFASDEDLLCLKTEDREASRLYAYLQKEAFRALERRQKTLEQVKTGEQIRAYQDRLRQAFVAQLGGFPERTPLEPRTSRRIDAGSFRIESVLFASRPGHHVTANLYLPKSRRPVPGVVVSSGHSRTGKTADYNQRFGLAMVRRGIAALCIDPIGQGERSQILDPAGQARHPGTTTEHFLMGVGSILVGRNTASYRVWDAMRAIDYLCGRSEIDPKRIGMTGCSGGGTLTSYVMALDERVACAAPACYLTTFRRLLETIGPQDAEQNIFAQLALGIDQPDYVIMRAPRPTLICSTTSDFFDISGSWDNLRQAKQIYTRLGRPEAVDLVEAEGTHGVQPAGLAAIAQWMQRWLLERDEPVPIEEYPARPPAELLCTEKAQVLSLPGERSVFALNAERARELAGTRKPVTPEALRARVRSVLQLPAADPAEPPAWKDLGRVRRGTYHVDRLLFDTGSGTPIPGLTFHPAGPRDEAYLYLHPGGKLGDAHTGGPIEKLVSERYAVVAIDLRGQGETGSERVDPLLGDWKTASLAYLLGKSLVGLRVADAIAVGRFVARYEKKNGPSRKVHLVGVGQAGIVALHAAALAPGLFATLALPGAPRDWNSIVADPNPAGYLEHAVHNVLAAYDLTDLVPLLGETKLVHA